MEISSFPMLHEALVRDLEQLDEAERPKGWPGNTVSGAIRFAFLDPESRDVVAEVRASALVPQVCQRSLEAFELAIDVDTKLLLSSSEESLEQDGFETWEVEGERLKPIDLVDELLVMALPFVAVNEKGAGSVAASDEDVPDKDTTRPFADLRAQMEGAKSPDETAGE